MRSRIDADFRRLLARLPVQVRNQARRAYRLFQQDPFHNSLQFKLLNEREQLYSVRIGQHYRALGIRNEDSEIVWFWIGSHAEYDTIIANL